MRFTISGTSIHVYLSRRNLMALVTKLDWAESMRTIGMEGDGASLWVTSEDDETHYGDRVPGQMHPFTEAQL